VLSTTRRSSSFIFASTHPLTPFGTAVNSPGSRATCKNSKFIVSNLSAFCWRNFNLLRDYLEYSFAHPLFPERYISVFDLSQLPLMDFHHISLGWEMKQKAINKAQRVGHARV
jgi:hypothetical protein